MDRYLDEATYRFNTRGQKDGSRFKDVASRVAGKRLTWEELDGLSAFPDSDPQLMYDLTTGRLQYQLSFADAIDSKIGIFLGWGGASLALLAATFALRPHEFHGLAVVTLVLSAIAYLVVAAASITALYGREWKTAPDIEAVLQAHGSTDERQLRWAVVSALIKAYRTNEPFYKIKSKCLTVSLIGVVIQTLLLALGLGLVAG